MGIPGRMVRRLLGASALALVLTAGPAAAGPLGAVLAPILGTAASAGAGALLGRAALQIGASLVLSMLTRATQDEPVSPGVRRQVEIGGDRTQFTVLGRYATAGHLVYSGSWGSASGAPNGYMTDVIVLSVLPGLTLRRLSVNGAWCTLEAAPDPDFPLLGPPVAEFRDGDGRPNLFVKFYGQGRTTAEPLLTGKLGSDPDWPWTSDMVGRGLAFAVVTSRYNPDVHRQAPKVLFEVDGIPLYDRRKDGTAGGVGPQRRADPTTWAQSDNPFVAIDTIMGPGLSYAGEHLFGPRLAPWSLPGASLVAAMNAADAVINLVNGGTQTAYRFGCELDLGSEPGEVVRELAKSASADMALCEGRFLFRSGPPQPAAMSFTDGDCSIDHDQELDPFKGVEDTFNGATSTFPDPEQGWAMSPAPPRYNAAWEAEDGGRRQLASVQYPFVPYVEQVQRLDLAYLRDNRTMRTHRVVLPPRFGGLEPVADFLSWTSARNGYLAKLFRIEDVTDLPGGWVAVTIVETDPADYNWTSSLQLAHAPQPVPLPIRTLALLPGVGVEPLILTDTSGAARRPALRLFWDPDELEGFTAVQWERRLAGTVAPVVSGSTADVSRGAQPLVEGVIGGQPYEVRAALVSRGRPGLWTGWMPVTAPDVDFGLADLDAFLTGQLAYLDEMVGDLVEDVSILELRGDDALDDVAEARMEALLYARQARTDGQADFAAVREETQALISDQREALASARTELGAAIGANASTILTEVQARADADQAIAISVQELSARTGTAEASIAVQAAALATVQGNASASYTLRLAAGGATAAMEFVAADNPTGPPASGITLRADLIRLDGTSIIAAATIQTLHIGERQVTIPLFGAWTLDTDLTSDSAWVLLGTWLVLPKVAGYGVKIDVGVQFAGYGDGVIQTSLWRDGVYLSGSSATAQTADNGIGDALAYSFYDPDTSGGSKSYSLRGRKLPARVAAGRTANLLVQGATMQLLELMR